MKATVFIPGFPSSICLTTGLYLAVTATLLAQLGKVTKETAADQRRQSTTLAYDAPIPNAPGVTHVMVLEWVCSRADAYLPGRGATELELLSSPTVGNVEPGLPYPDHYPPGAGFTGSGESGADSINSLNGMISFKVARWQGPIPDVSLDFEDGYRYRLTWEVKIPAVASGAVVSTVILEELGPDDRLFSVSLAMAPSPNVQSFPAPAMAARPQLFLRLRHQRGSGVRNIRSLTVNGQVWPIPSELAAQLHPFLIVRQPLPEHTAIRGESIDYRVDVSGGPQLSYQWQWAASIGGEYRDLPGANAATLKMTDLQVADAGSYRVLIMGGGVMIPSDPSTLRVILPASDRPLGKVADGAPEGQIVFTYNEPIPNPPGTTQTVEVEWVTDGRVVNQRVAGVTLVSSPDTPMDWNPVRSREPALGFPSHYAPQAYVYTFQGYPLQGHSLYGSSRNVLLAAASGFVAGRVYRLTKTLRMPDVPESPVTATVSVHDLGPEAEPFTVPVAIGYEVHNENPTPGVPQTVAGPSPPLARQARLHLRLVDWSRPGVERVKSVRVNGAPWAIPGSLKPLKLTQPPVAQTVKAGEPATFSVGVEGGDNHRYQWQVQLTLDAPWFSLSHTSSSFTIPSAQVYQASRFRVIVTAGGESVTSAPVALFVKPPPASAARLLNLSTRAFTASEFDNVIVGFVTTGATAMNLLLRAAGPRLGLAPFFVPGVMADPRVVLKRAVGSEYIDVAANRNWGESGDATEVVAAAARVGAFELHAGSADAALLAKVNAGQYSAIVDGEAGTSGVAIVELYDIGDGGTSARLVNLSTRGQVGVGNNIMIAGFVISGEGPLTLLIRVVGPRLMQFGVPAALPDPVATLFRGHETLFVNDDWSLFPHATELASVAAKVGAFALVPNSKDAAMLVTLAPGAYTVQASGANNTTGIALLEVYLVP